MLEDNRIIIENVKSNCDRDNIMPLRIKLPSKEKIIINGAVIENAGEQTTLIIHNRVDLLRRKEVLNEEQANTPARHVYYSLQCAYLFEDNRDSYLEHFNQFLKEYIQAAPSAQSIADAIQVEIDKENFYQALRVAHELMEHEAERFRHIGMSLPDQL